MKLGIQILSQNSLIEMSFLMQIGLGVRIHDTQRLTFACSLASTMFISMRKSNQQSLNLAQRQRIDLCQLLPLN